ncbi:type I DNA topoisomerase, partial [Candidatus Gottesmanbacteria bacterium]|nr:type I DNA topoisomerase [Candidatus Gottesmanbacteria bacterium]
MNLVIVESPTKARTLARFLGGDYQIEATMGHIRDLPKKKLAIDIENNFKPEYVIVPGRRKEISQIQEKAKLATKIILATDPDREGEAIAYHVAVICSNEKFKMKNEKFSRIVFHEITESAIKEALATPRDIDMNLVDAQQARRVLDRLVGYKLSPLLWRKIRRGLSAGRVQSVAVRLIVEREREIEAFKPEEYWVIQAELEKWQMANGKWQMFLATLIEKDGQKIKIGNKEQADKLVAELEKLTYKVKDIKTEEVRRYPFPPFTTSTMQQAASILFGWTSKRTMQVAQKLYEQGLITYHRTDSVNLAKQAIFAVRSFIEKEYGKNYLADAPRIYKT